MHLQVTGTAHAVADDGGTALGPASGTVSVPGGLLLCCMAAMESPPASAAPAAITSRGPSSLGTQPRIPWEGLRSAGGAESGVIDNLSRAGPLQARFLPVRTAKFLC